MSPVINLARLGNAWAGTFFQRGTNMPFACEITDHDESLGGKITRLGFATRADAETFGKKEVAASQEIFLEPTLVTFKVLETE